MFIANFSKFIRIDYLAAICWTANEDVVLLPASHRETIDEHLSPLVQGQIIPVKDFLVSCLVLTCASDACVLVLVMLDFKEGLQMGNTVLVMISYLLNYQYGHLNIMHQSLGNIRLNNFVSCRVK